MDVGILIFDVFTFSQKSASSMCDVHRRTVGDRGADEAKGEQVIGITASELAKMANQIQERTDVDIPLDDVDFLDWEEVMAKVNGALGEPVLMIKSEPNLYRMPVYIYELVKSRTATPDAE